MDNSVAIVNAFQQELAIFKARMSEVTKHASRLEELALELEKENGFLSNELSNVRLMLSDVDSNAFDDAIFEEYVEDEYDEPPYGGVETEDY
jgi:hypothetical protein